MDKVNDYFQIKYAAALLGIIAFVGALIYRVYALDWVGILATCFLSLAIFIPFLKLEIRNGGGRTADGSKADRPFILLSLAYAILFASALYVLFDHRVSKSIISPWQVVPVEFFIIYGSATAVLLLALTKQAPKAHKVVFASFHYFLSFSVALSVYRIGYGYDPFVHEATLKVIAETGSVAPKTFYYLGHYSLVTIAHKIFFLPIGFANSVLVPALAAIFLPAFISNSFAAAMKGGRPVLLALLSLSLPFSFFIISTPQGLAYLFLILALLASLSGEKNHLAYTYIFSLAAAMTHPIAGIPALALALIMTVEAAATRFKTLLSIIIYSLTALSLPLAFFILSGGNALSWSWESMAIPSPIMPWRENFLYNGLYLYGFNSGWLIAFLILAGTGVFLASKKNYAFSRYGLMSFALFLSYLMTKNLSFPYLISYERSDFPERILLVAVIFSSPFMALAIDRLADMVLRQNRLIKTSFFIFALILLSASLYFSYPRFDKYFNSRGYSTGENDIQAVRSINDSAGDDYIVLANQQVSAAALHEFGFNKYHNGLFYYPVPTSGPLYQYYLDMVYKKPDRDTILRAMDLAGVREGYFVLNKYWWAFPKLLDEAKLEADAYWDIGKGDVYIFRYGK